MREEAVRVVRRWVLQVTVVALLAALVSPAFGQGWGVYEVQPATFHAEQATQALEAIRATGAIGPEARFRQLGQLQVRVKGRAAVHAIAPDACVEAL